MLPFINELTALFNQGEFAVKHAYKCVNFFLKLTIIACMSMMTHVQSKVLSISVLRSCEQTML